MDEDLSNSPGHHTRTVQLDADFVKDANAVAPTWVHHFCHIGELLKLGLYVGRFDTGILRSATWIITYPQNPPHT